MKTLLKVINVLKPYNLDIGHLEYTADDKITVSLGIFFDEDSVNIINELKCLKNVKAVHIIDYRIIIDLGI